MDIKVGDIIQLKGFNDLSEKARVHLVIAGSRDEYINNKISIKTASYFADKEQVIQVYKPSI